MSKKSIDIVIPVLNEEKSLPICLEKILFYIKDNKQYKWYIIIADNGSTDSTNLIASSYAEQYKNISLVTLSKRGRGRALKKAWLSSHSDVSMYMDVDLSTDLKFTTLLVDEIIKNNYDVAIGSRLHRKSKVYESALVPIILGLVVGFIAAIMGVGGAFLMVPAMIYLIGMPTKLVPGTSLFVTIFITGFVTISHALSFNTIDLVLVLILITGSIAGVHSGQKMDV